MSAPEDAQFADSTVVITGSAQGIGHACAYEFARQGGTVIGGDIRSQDETARRLEDTSGTFRSVTVDISDPASVEDLVDTAASGGGIDVLVNNAGVVERGSIRETTEDEWDDVVDVNLRGTYNVTRAFADSLCDRSGAVVNMSSIYSKVGKADRSVYATTKSGIDGLTRALAAEFGDHGVRVNAVNPALIRTPQAEERLNDEEAARSARELTALKKIGDPREVAEVVAFLASEKASYVTGQTIPIDGGRTVVEA